MTSTLSPENERQAIALVRGLAMDAPLQANSGHQGTAMALAPLGHVLYSRVMKHDPADPHWPDRDRFVLSNGHASILQYSLLALSGYGLELDDLRAFRQWESVTPGHPEVGVTPGIETTTGPLGQGFANAVGMAVAERFLSDRFGSDVVDHFTYVVAGDGCFMEGVSHEAASLAGHLGLGRLICVFDDNRVTIDGATELTVSDDVAGRFRAYGWDVTELGDVADDCDALEAALLDAKHVTDRPSLLVLRTHIATPSPDHTDTHEAHGNPFSAEDVTRTKAALGVPDVPFWAPDDVIDEYRRHTTTRGRDAHDAWRERLADLDDDVRARWDAAWAATGTDGWAAELPVFEPGASLPTRKAITAALDATAAGLPGVLAGAADLTGNTGAQLPGADIQSLKAPGGAQLYYGVREHGMGAAMVGMALHGGVLAVGGTFFVFADYMRPAIRLASLSGAKVVFVFSHDSVGVGEDGPTHQPIEQLASLRAIPDLQVIRPADANETVEAWRAAVEHDGPTALVLSRQAITVCTDGSAVRRGAGIVRDSATSPDIVLVGTGSEVEVCVAAADRLAGIGVGARVVSLPSWDRFETQPLEVHDEVFPAGVPVVSVEAATTFGWERFADDSVGIDRFGASAPGDTVLEQFGIHADHVRDRALELLAVVHDTEEVTRS